VRFQIGDTHWERLIDRPGRFEKKAHFRKGGTYKGHCWIPPRLTMEDIAKADEILIAEGIFDAVALCQVRKVAVSAMSTNNWPEHFSRRAARRAGAHWPHRPPAPGLRLRRGPRGVEATTKYVKRAITEGWDASAMQVRPDGEGTKKDWNDLLKDHLDWAGDPDKAPLSDWAFDQYRYNGAITIAETARDKARLMADHKMAVSSFEFRHKNRLWSCKVSFDEESESAASWSRKSPTARSACSIASSMRSPARRPISCKSTSPTIGNPQGPLLFRGLREQRRVQEAADDLGRIVERNQRAIRPHHPQPDPQPQGRRADQVHRLFARPPRLGAGRHGRARRQADQN
jgi:hypothetical protein